MKTVGEQLKEEFGLKKFEYVYIQKVRNVPYRFYVITVDSHLRTIPIPVSRMVKSLSVDMKKIVSVNPYSNIVRTTRFKLTLPKRIEYFNIPLTPSTVIIRRDLGFDYWQKRKNFVFLTSTK